MPVIIWINGGFAAGKTTLAEELHRRLPDAVVYDPEDVGLMLWKWMRPNGDFQHLPSWPRAQFPTRHERTPGALPAENLLPQDVCMPAVLGEFPQYVQVHPAQRERSPPVAVHPVVQPQG